MPFPFLARLHHCLTSRQHNQTNLPAYQPTIPPPLSHDPHYQATTDATKSLTSDPIRALLEARRKCPSNIFLDIERIAQCWLEHDDVMQFVEACENELAIMYALYPQYMLAGVDNHMLALFAQVIAIPDSLVHDSLDEEASGRLKEFMRKRSVLKDHVERVKRDRLSLCKRVKRGDVEGVVNDVLPLMDKGITLCETIRNMEAPQASVQCEHAVKRFKWFTSNVPLELVFTTRHLIIFKLKRGKKWYKLHVPIDAVRMRKVDASGLLVLCVDYLGVVMNLRCRGGDDAAEYVLAKHSVLLSHHQRLDSLPKPTKEPMRPKESKEPTLGEQRYKDIVQWPAPHHSNGTRLRQGVIHTCAQEMADKPCALYKFADSQWEPMGRCQMRLEAGPTGEWLLVVRSQETGLVRLTHSLTTSPHTVDIYPQQRSFSCLHTHNGDKSVYQVKVKGDTVLDALRKIIDHVTVCREELQQWRQSDTHTGNPVLVSLVECQMTVVFGSGADCECKPVVCEYQPGAMNLLTSGKFEYNHTEGVVIGWIGELWCHCDQDDLVCQQDQGDHTSKQDDHTSMNVYAHGAVLTTTSGNRQRLSWGTITIACTSAANLLHHSASIRHDYAMDLHAQLTSYCRAVNVVATADKGALFEDDLQLSAIFVDPPAGDDKKRHKHSSFEQTPIGRLWAFGLEL